MAPTIPLGTVRSAAIINLKKTIGLKWSGVTLPLPRTSTIPAGSIARPDPLDAILDVLSNYLKNWKIKLDATNYLCDQFEQIFPSADLPLALSNDLPACIFSVASTSGVL